MPAATARSQPGACKYRQNRNMAKHEIAAAGTSVVTSRPWASTFGQVVTGWELDATGVNYRLNSRFAKFQNVPELSSMQVEPPV